MITEDYVSFETALLLKKKGFEQIGCQKQYNTQRGLCIGYCYGPVAPTLQMAMKWLREVHNIFINIIYENDGVFTANIKVPSIGVDCKVDNKHKCWLTYEEAAEAAIKYCLENLV